MTSLAPPVADGEIIGGKYRVERVLGEGAFGVVVAARHIELEEDVAIKFLRRKGAQDKAVVERFMREARAAVRLKNEHVVRVLDIDKMPTGAPYIVMEHLTGSDLEVVLARRGQLPVDEAVGYVLQVCEALAEAHAMGMVHRDLKPSNIFITTRPDGSSLVKVLDFGIAKWKSEDPAAKKLTADDVSMGTPLYMSPEQLRDSAGADARADIWSLGVILHELIAGKPPFDASTAHGIMAAVLTEAPPALRSIVATAPAALEAMLLRCMDRDRDARIGSIAELARALSPFASAEDQGSIARVERMKATAATRIGHPSVPDATEATPKVLADPARATQHTAAIPEPPEDAEDVAAGIPGPRRKLTYAIACAAIVGVAALVALQARRPSGRSEPPRESLGLIAAPAIDSVPTASLPTAGSGAASASPSPSAERSAAAVASTAAPLGLTVPNAARNAAGTTRETTAPAQANSTGPGKASPTKPTGKDDDVRQLLDQRR